MDFYAHVHGGRAAPPSAIAPFEKDYMFETVAHEIGHVLGLQHNFEASNIAADRVPGDLIDVGRQYFDRQQTPSDLSISVMEYLPMPIVGMLGSYMRTHMLPHDLRAISLGYFGKNVDLVSEFGPELGRKAAALPYCNNDNQEAPSCVQFDHPLCKFVGGCYNDE